MTNIVEEISTALRTLDKDIIDGVESNAVGKIPGWKKAMVSRTD